MIAVTGLLFFLQWTIGINTKKKPKKLARRKKLKTRDRVSDSSLSEEEASASNSVSVDNSPEDGKLIFFDLLLRFEL